MIDIDIINSMLKGISIYLFIFFIFLKIINYKNLSNRKIVVITICAIMNSILYAFLLEKISFVVANLICIPICSIVVSYITKNKIVDSIGIMIISLGLIYGVLMISSIIVMLIMCIFFHNLGGKKLLVMSLTLIVQAILIFLIFKTRRFKNRNFFR